MLEIPIKHPCWEDVVFLQPDGQFKRKQNGDGGTWIRTKDGRLRLSWEQWPPEDFCVGHNGDDFWRPRYFPDWEKLNLTPPRSFILIDLGFHHGEGLNYLTKRYSIDRTWTVFAFEPNSKCRDKLFEHKGVIPMPYAAGVQAGIAPFQREATCPGGAEAGQGSHLQEIGMTIDCQGGGIEEVHVIDFPTFLSSIVPPQRDGMFVIVKMDIEGAEYGILRQLIAQELVTRIDILHVEFHHRFLDTEDHETTDALKEQLRKHVDLIDHW